MNRFLVNITANFRLRSGMQTIPEQYQDLWRFAKVLETMGIPMDEWHPPADSEENTLLNKAFTEAGPTAAALALAHADREQYGRMRSLGVWNGRQEKGLVYTTNVNDGRLFCFFDFTTHSVEPLTEYRNVLRVVRSIIDIWRPVIVRVEPEGYEKKRVFADRPSVGWMLHLPFTITASQVPEAADLIAVMDGKKQTGTIVVSVPDTFDMNNPEHIARANAIETRLVDQDLLPTNMELLHKF